MNEKHCWASIQRDDPRRFCTLCMTLWDGSDEPPETCVTAGTPQEASKALAHLRAEAAERPLVEATREQLENEVLIQSERAERAERLLAAAEARGDRAQMSAEAQAARATTAEKALDDIVEAVAAAKARGLAAQATATEKTTPEEKPKPHPGIARIGESQRDYPVVKKP